MESVSVALSQTETETPHFPTLILDFPHLPTLQRAVKLAHAHKIEHRQELETCAYFCGTPGDCLAMDDRTKLLFLYAIKMVDRFFIRGGVDKYAFENMATPLSHSDFEN